MPNIIGGKYKRTKLAVPNKLVRPTSALKREAIFSILESYSIQHSIEIYKNKSIIDMFAGSGLIGLEAISRGMKKSYFIENNYEDWTQKNTDSLLSPSVFQNHLLPSIKNNQKVCMIIVDCMRCDQFLSVLPYLESLFNIELSYHISLIPSATPYSRNAIFSGLFPIQIQQYYPERWAQMEYDETSMNRFEEEFKKFESPMVFSCEPPSHLFYWIAGYYRWRVFGPDPVINGGSYMGYAGAIKKFIQRIKYSPSTDDQRFLTSLYKHVHMTIDFESRLFYHHAGWLKVRGKIPNTCIVTFPGSGYTKNILKKMGS